MEVPEEVGSDFQDIGPGGGGRPDLWYVIQSGRAGDTFLDQRHG